MRTGDWSVGIALRRSSAYALLELWSGQANVGEYDAKMSAPDCAAPVRKSKSDSTAPTGCVFAAATCRCTPVRRPSDPQVLPAYGLQGLRIANPNPQPKSKPTTLRLPIIHGASPGSGQF